MASSRRTVGSGRVFGTTKPTAPSTAVTNDSPAAREPSSSNIHSPSDSTVSLPSHGSSTPRTLLEENDISSAATRDAATATSNNSSRLFCPACNEEMLTLLQLNRHLDSEHQELEVQEQDEVINWFRSQVVKAKKFQPLVAFNQKLKGLEAFESNENQRSANQSPSRPPAGITATESVRQDADDLVTKDHWQRYTRDGLCSDPICDHRLGGANGNINCRSCGKLFCEEHSMYQMRLSRSAQWEPVRGYWCRVCETCYKSRPGYNDHTGFERDHMKDFASIRRKTVDKNYLEVSRLEKRLTKLTHLLADPALHEEQGIVGYLWSLSSGAPNQRRQIEQSIVDWEDDASVAQCPFCMQEFSNYTFKRHHCRLCGRVVCSDPATQCSSEVPLTVASTHTSTTTTPQQEKTTPQIPIDIRMCQECKRTVFSKADFDRQLAESPADQRAFKNLKEFDRGIRSILPRFQKLLTALQDPEKPPTPTQLNEAARVRKRLTDSFTQYTVAAQRIRDLPTTSPTQKRLQTQIYAQASQFLHMHMLPLKALPKTLKHASPYGSQASPQVNGLLSTATTSGPSQRPGHSPSASHDSTQSSALNSLEGEEKDLRERLMVLEEQKVVVGEMLAEARRRRKVEEVESLRRNLDDLGRECDSLNSQLEGVRKGFEGFYVGNGAPAALGSKNPP